MTRRRAREGRAISTVVDVSFALLLISASVVMIATYLNGQQTQPDTAEADQLAETLAVTTVQTEYSLEAVAEESDEVDVGDLEEETYTRRAHGPAAEQLAAAAVTNVSVEGTRVSAAAKPFNDSLDGSIRNELTSAETNAHVVAVWEPYRDADIRGRTEVGVRPPTDADVSTATMTVNSRIGKVSDGEIVARFDEDGYEGVADLIAAATVAGYFPEQETQLALEQQTFERAYAVYRYNRFKQSLNSWDDADAADAVDYSFADYDPINTIIDRNAADTREANDRVQRRMAAGIEADLADEFGDESDLTGDELARHVSTRNVTVTVRTWDK